MQRPDASGQINFIFHAKLIMPEGYAKLAKLWHHIFLATFFSAIYETLKPGGKLLVAEPDGHVSEQDFEITISVSEQNGFKAIDSPKIGRSRTVLLGKK